MPRSIKTVAVAKPTSGASFRLGLCCQFAEQPIRFRATTASSLLRLSLEERRRKVSELCLANADALLASLEYCAAHGIGCFRIISSILPVKTHPTAGYVIDDLPAADAIVAAFRACGAFAAEREIRTVFHPDQFVVLSSVKPELVQSSLAEIEYHAEVSDWVGADVINIHGGGAYGDKQAALATFARNVDRLSDSARSRLTVENDDKTYTPADLLPLCHATGLPLVYDAHHHRCLRDDLSIEQATTEALTTWRREPLFHLSSPLQGWTGRHPSRHHDYIDIHDLPDCWRTLPITVEIEAKAKELAVARMQSDLLRSATGSTELEPVNAGANRHAR